MTKVQPLMKIRLFIDGVVDESTASAVYQRARAIQDVIKCRVSVDGTCTVQCKATMTRANAERTLIDQLTFEKYTAKIASDVDGLHISHIEVQIGGVHETNHDYVSNRLCQGIDGLLSCQFSNNGDGQAKISFDTRRLDQFTLLSAIQRFGHPVQLITSDSHIEADKAQVQLRIEGMHCNSCVSNICGAIEDLPGTLDIQLTFQDKIATINFDPRVLKVDHAIREIENLGFKAALTNNNPNQDDIVTSSKVTFKPRHPLEKKTHAQVTKEDSSSETCFFNVLGMTCASCVDRIQRHISKTEGVHAVYVALLAQRAEVKYDPEYLLPSQIAGFINDLGFQAEVLDTVTRGKEVMDVTIEGMTCASCVSKIEKYMAKVPGVTSVDVALLTNRGRIKYDASLIGPRDIISRLTDLGFPAQVLAENLKSEGLARAHQQTTRKWRNSFILAAAFGVPAMTIMLVFMFKYKDHAAAPHVMPGLSVENLVMFLLATPVQIISGRYFYVQAYKALKHKTANMDLLIVLATTIAYAYSFIVVIVNMILKVPSPMSFFDVSPMLFMFVSLGRWLEHIAKGKTSEALKKLLALQPPQGTLVKLDERGKIIEEKPISAQLIQRDDLLKVLPGETIPTDGHIVDGATSCDESLITGESMPVDKTVGAQVVGGTKNLVGLIIMRATHVGQETALKQIIKLVEDAQTSKAPIQELADTIAGYFVPLVLAVSLLVLIIYIILGYTMFEKMREYSSYAHSHTYHAKKTEIILELAFRYAITVLSVACPCALGLATPTAVMVGTGVGASNGILIKGGEPLEAAHRVHTIVFDKTGTITKGKPSVVNKRIFIQNEHMTCDRMLAIAATAESGSEHPLGLAVRNHCKEHFGSDAMGHCQDFKATWGYGLTARVTDIECLVPSKDASRSYLVLIGNREWMTRNKLKIDDGVDKTMSKHENDGHTAILIAIDGNLVGMLAIADEIKPTAPLTIYALQSLGLQTILLTGDNVKTARAIAAQVGIKSVYAEVLPTQKERFIAKLKEQMKPGDKVAMVGDGINDSPALARADVGIAVGTGADVAVEAANIVLIRNELFDVVAAIKLSKATVWRIRINFIFASVYNLVGIPIAAGVLLPAGVQLMPWIASAAMAVSSVSVVTSSLLLRYFRKPTMNSNDIRFRQWSQNKSVGVIVRRGIDNLPQNSKKSTSILSSLKSSQLSQIVSKSISAVKHAVNDDYKKAGALLNENQLISQNHAEEMELEVTAF